MHNAHRQSPTASFALQLQHVSADGRWQSFFDTYWNLVYRTACAAGLGKEAAGRAAEETLLSVGEEVLNLGGDSRQETFKAWLRTVTAWRIHDQLARRRESSAPQSVSNCDATSLEAVIAKQWETDWERNLTDAALDRLKKRVEPKHFQIFDLAMVKGWPADRIAKALHISVGYVYLVRHRVSALFSSELRKLKRQPWEMAEPAPSL